MTQYLVEATYTPGAVGTMVSHPQNRREALRPVIERLGGRLDAFFHVASEPAAVAIVDLPDTAAAAAFVMAVTSSGAVRSLTLRALLTPEEAMLSMAAAAHMQYQPPIAKT